MSEKQFNRKKNREFTNPEVVFKCIQQEIKTFKKFLLKLKQLILFLFDRTATDDPIEAH